MQNKIIMYGKNVNKEINYAKNLNFNNEENSKEEFDWYIEIPKIKVYAPIEEGTNEEILSKYVGHFESTSRRNGNCGLISLNKDYKVNYFSRLKELEKNDILYYFVDSKKYKYKINDIFVIYETDLTILDETKENIITLITCIENRNEYRLCVRGVLVEE